MAAPGKHVDAGSLIVMCITLALFIAALFFKGFGHDLLLEAGVFLVSVKLIIMSYKNAVASQQLSEQMNAILAELQRSEKSQPPAGDAGDRA